MAPVGFRVQVEALRARVAELRDLQTTLQQRGASAFQAQPVFGTREYAYYLAARHEWAMGCTKDLLTWLASGLGDAAHRLETTRENYERADRLPMHGEPPAEPQVPGQGRQHPAYPQPPQSGGHPSLEG